MTAQCTWDAVPDVDGYNIYLKTGTGNFIKQNINLIVPTQFDITELGPNEYEVFVRASFANLESVPSTTIAFEVTSQNQAYSAAYNLNAYG